jgi:hypothetical protein
VRHDVPAEGLRDQVGGHGAGGAGGVKLGSDPRERAV